MLVMEEMENIKTMEMQTCDKADDPKIIRSGRYFLGYSLLNQSVLENAVVGLDDDIVDLKERLTGFPRNLEIIPIVGTGGIGKSTLARIVYDDPFIVYHFYVRAWITISPEYDVKSILLSLVRSVSQLRDDIYGNNDDSDQGQITLKDRIDQLSYKMLAEQLYKKLRGKRYLIVMDDIWLNNPWDDIKGSFPDDKIGSRLVLTSRHKDVDHHCESFGQPHHTRFLNDDQGWDLLKLKVFPQQCCPLELEDVGKKILKKCGGLPLAIVVVACHLSKTSREKDVWLSVANNVGSLVTRNRAFLDVIAMSYNHLPHHLKACFLYMGAFPETIDIPVWRLTAFWVAEGFLKRDSSKDLEDLAEECLEELISRSLIMVEKRTNNKIVTCRIHDLLRDFCLKEAQKEKFWHVMRRNDLFPDGEESYHRRLCTHSDVFPYVTEQHSNPQIRTFLSSSPNRLSFLSDSILTRMGFKLLWLLDLVNYYFSDFPTLVTKLVHLRYLALSTSGDLPSATSSDTIGRWCLFPFVISLRSDHPVSISNLTNLQMLVINWGLREKHSLPLDILKMTQLRHIRMRGGFIHFDKLFLEEMNERRSLVLPNLRTLLTVSSANFCMEIVAILPNLKKLGIVVDDNKTGFLNDLFSLHFLETLKLSFSSQVGKNSISPWNAFPPNLKVLTLSGSCLLWEDMVTISKIPNLQVLKLKQRAFIGEVWNTIEGGFLQLKFLKLENSEIEVWNATEFDFPILEHLVLRFCNNLKAIPCAIGDISTLQVIELYSCGRSAVASAKKIQEYQQNSGNDDLEVRVNMV